MKSLQQHIEEKLVIGKGIKVSNPNNLFYETFKNDFVKLTKHGFFSNELKDLKSSPFLNRHFGSYINDINELFQDSNINPKYWGYCNHYWQHEIYSNMINFVKEHNDTMSFIKNEKEPCSTIIFETDDEIIALLEGSLNYDNDNYFSKVIIFQYKEKNKK